MWKLFVRKSLAVVTGLSIVVPLLLSSHFHAGVAASPPAFSASLDSKRLRIDAHNVSAVATPDVQALRRRILADPDIQHREKPPDLPSISLPNAPDVDLSFLPYVFMAIGGIMLVVLIILVAPSLLRYFTTLRRRGATRHALVDGLDIATVDEAMRQGQTAAAGLDYRLAVRLLYLASLLKLDEIGALRYDRALTNREYVREAAGVRPALAVTLRPVVETFDDVWYGYRTLTLAGFDAFEATVKLLMAEADQEAIK